MSKYVVMEMVLEQKAIMPERYHEDDAGLDLFTPIDFFVKPGGRFTVFTGVHVRLPVGMFGDIRAKSGLLREKGIITAGTIDEGYTGSIAVIVVNTSEHTVEFKRGDKIAQLVIMECIKPDIKLVSFLPKTARGGAGFGSSGLRPKVDNEQSEYGYYPAKKEWSDEKK